MSLYRNINKRKKAGTSRSKKKSTISPKAYANMKAGFPKAKKGGTVKKAKGMNKGGTLKKVPAGNKGLKKLPKKVRNKIKPYMIHFNYLNGIQSKIGKIKYYKRWYM